MPPNDRMALAVAGGTVALLLAVTFPTGSEVRLGAQSPSRHVIEVTPEADTWFEVNEPPTGAPVNPSPQGGSEALQAGWSDMGFDEYALMRFALPADLPAEQVARAELVLQVGAASIFTYDFPLPVSGTLSLSLSHVLNAWDESTLSSLTPPRIARLGGVRAEKEWRPCHGENCGDALADVTPLVRDWLDGDADNNGLALHASGHLGERPVMGTVFVVLSRESAHPPVLRIELVGEDETPTPPTPTLPPPTPTTAPTSRPSRPVWVPLALRYPIVLPTVTPSPGPSETSTCTPTPGTGRYLLVERWEHQERGPGCCGLMLIDFPTYRFIPESGILRLYPRFGWNPALEATDIGYYGAGRSVEGENSGGEDSGLERIVTLPFDADDIQIRSVDDAGAVVVARGGEDIPLSAGSERHWHWVGPGRGEAPECVITTTLRVTNYGYQDQAKIVNDN